jgi:uncharacterized repeat protein (TIGR01451 family)
MQAVAFVSSVCLAVLIAAPASSVDAASVTVHMTNHRVVLDGDGKEQLSDGARAHPGDVLEYHVVYRNEGKAPAKDLLATLPVPANTLVYLPSTAFPQGVLASLDGKTYAAPPLVRTVTLADGTKATREVPVTEYRFLRWRVAELRPGASLTVGARMRIVAETAEGASSK